MRRRIRTEEDKKKQTSQQSAVRSRSKDIIQRLKKIYNIHSTEHQSPFIIGTQLKNNQKATTPNKNLKLTILSRSKTPRQNSPCTNLPTSTFTNNKEYQTNINTGRRLQELKRKMTENKPFSKLNGTQRYFKKQKALATRVDTSMNETLRMVWDLKPKKPKYEFKMIKKLGKSQNGQIILAVSNTSHMLVAIKTFAKKDVKIDYLIDQLKIHLCCHHPNILPAYGININSEEAYLAMEVGEGNLYQKIIKYAPFEEQTAAVYISQIANGVAYLHQLGVMHRDIKPQNIICFGNVLKIADFGWSIITTKPRKTLCGTLDYLSPEVANRESYNNKIDCWSIGVLMYELITGQAPFQQQQKLKQMTFEQITLPKGISEQAQDLLLKMLEINPINRLSAKQILQHEWIKLHTAKAKQENRKTYRKLEIELNNILS